jgi:hypothetical protein
MSELRIGVSILFLAVTLATFGVVGVEPAAAAEVGTEVESAMERRARDADFIRHNYGVNPWAVKAVVDTKARATFEKSVREIDFLRHNCGTYPEAVNRVVDSRARAAFDPRAWGIDFARHNCGTHLCGVKVQARQPLQAQGDSESIEY